MRKPARSPLGGTALRELAAKVSSSSSRSNVPPLLSNAPAGPAPKALSLRHSLRSEGTWPSRGLTASQPTASHSWLPPSASVARWPCERRAYARVEAPTGPTALWSTWSKDNTWFVTKPSASDATPESPSQLRDSRSSSRRCLRAARSDARAGPALAVRLLLLKSRATS